MHRVHVDSFRLIDGLYVPCLPDGRQTFLCMQPGAVESFLSAPEKDVCLSGPRGPGKSLALLADYLQDVDAGWGAAWKGQILRRSLTGFDEFRSLANQFISRIFPRASFNQNANRWIFPGGEVLTFRYFDQDIDYSTFLGGSATFLGFEELTQWNDDSALRMMLATLRSTVPNIPLRLRSTCNPDGPSHSHIKRRYQASDFFALGGYQIGPRIEADDIGPDRRMIYAKLAENQLMLTTQPDYLANTKTAAITEGRYAAWVNGSWEILSGDMFSDIWDQAKPYAMLPAIPATSIPGSWRIDRALDFGDSAPFSVLWFAESDGSSIKVDGRTINTIRGDLLLFAEWYGAGREPGKGLRLPASMIRDGIIEREIEMGLRSQDPITAKWTSRVYPGPADTQIFNIKPGAGGIEPTGSIADDFAEATTINGHKFAGIRWEEANKNPHTRAQGWQAIRSRLYATIPTKDGIREKAGLFICENVRSFFDHVLTLPRDLKNNREDIPQTTGIIDHTGDATRYRMLHSTKPRLRSYRIGA